MTLTITDLDDIPQDIVDQMFAEATQLMREHHPEQALQRGPFTDIVLYFRSIFAAGGQVNYDRLRQSMSLRRIELDPTLADDGVVDDVLSNHLVDRLAAGRATGMIGVVVAVDATVIIAAGAVFTAGSVDFVADTAVIARPSNGSAISETDRVLASRNDGTYEFSFPATAVVAGAPGNIRRGTRLAPTSRPENFVAAYAAADFAGGSAAETNAALLLKLQEGLAAKSMGGSLNWVALLKKQPTFARTLDYSIRGFGDPEQLRDQHTIWPGSLGGRVDIYARTQLLPLAAAQKLEARLVDFVAGGAVWQFSLPADVAPGFYEVTRIAALDAGQDDTGYQVVADIRGYDLEDDGFIPDITSIFEAAYTKYQTTVIRFLNTDTTTELNALGDVEEFVVDVLYMPLIAELQDFCNGEDHRPKPCDVVVRAAVPCFTSVSLLVRKDATDPSPDVAAMADAIAAAVNAAGFCGRLHASTLSDIAHNYLVDRQAISRVAMNGRIRRADGEMIYISDPTELEIPDDPGLMLSKDTVVFILDPSDVAISVISN
jgi:hypothetical protein